MQRKPVGARRKAISALVVAVLLAGITLAFFWPGIASYDSVVQYQQVLAGAFDDWHPPAMARLWALLHGLGWRGQAPMFVLQILLYWGGLALFAGALARRGQSLVALVVLLLGFWPPLLGWQVAVLKDAQMTGALAAAVGVASWWRLDDRRLPLWAAALVLVLLGYATLVRFNAAFAAVPLAFGLLGGWRWDRPLFQAVLVLAAIAAVLGMLTPINQRLLHAQPSGVERSLPLFDLAGIAHRAGPQAVPQVPARLWHRAEAKGCLTPILWDPIGDQKACGYIVDTLQRAAPGKQLRNLWLEAIATHPLAYAAHRIAHWNSEMRLWMPATMPGTGPLGRSEPNSLGLPSPDKRITGFQKLGYTLASSAAGAPILWFAIALGVLFCTWPARDGAGSVAVTLALSTILTELAFGLVGVASDYRYHCWGMLAAGLALLAATGTRPAPHRVLVALLGIAAVAAIVVAARWTLPPALPPL
ncbi:hypothetical protein [Sphingomonas azotifigens]|uniref:hypothetical protein n=1 Tax=Sphingomonas azotifigens TaxID=330920 RepID=UPI001FE3D7D9|nr:hypothetical protein [Sphingomonas azotifigens]